MRKSKNRIKSEELKGKIISDFQAGLSGSVIAFKYGLTQGYVSAVVSDHLRYNATGTGNLDAPEFWNPETEIDSQKKKCNFDLCLISTI